MTPEEYDQIDLKRPGRAAALAWLVPGLGHLYQGRTTKGLLFLLTIVPLFVFGFYVGGGRVAYAASAPIDPIPRRFVVERWQFLCQAGIGAVAIPALVERARYRSGDAPLLGGAFYPPRTGLAAKRGPKNTSTDDAGATVTHPDQLAKWHYDYGYYFELGTIYTVIAGLLNLLAVYDAGAGPLVLPVKEEQVNEEIVDVELGNDQPSSDAGANPASPTGATADKP